MRLNTYLGFNGECEAAFKFYANVLGGKVEAMMRWKEMPGQKVGPELAEKIMHARVTVDQDVIMGADAMPGKYETPKNFHVTINIKETAEADRVFRQLSEGGKVTMPIQETFWAKRFGMLVDRFGTPWMINCEMQSRE